MRVCVWPTKCRLDMDISRRWTVSFGGTFDSVPSGTHSLEMAVYYIKMHQMHHSTQYSNAIHAPHWYQCRHLIDEHVWCPLSVVRCLMCEEIDKTEDDYTCVREDENRNGVFLSNFIVWLVANSYSNEFSAFVSNTTYCFYGSLWIALLSFATVSDRDKR